jgi:hypothetical protein
VSGIDFSTGPNEAGWGGSTEAAEVGEEEEESTPPISAVLPPCRRVQAQRCEEGTDGDWKFGTACRVERVGDWHRGITGPASRAEMSGVE